MEEAGKHEIFSSTQSTKKVKEEEEVNWTAYVKKTSDAIVEEIINSINSSGAAVDVAEAIITEDKRRKRERGSPERSSSRSRATHKHKKNKKEKKHKKHHSRSRSRDRKERKRKSPTPTGTLKDIQRTGTLRDIKRSADVKKIKLEEDSTGWKKGIEEEEDDLPMGADYRTVMHEAIASSSQSSLPLADVNHESAISKDMGTVKEENGDGKIDENETRDSDGNGHQSFGPVPPVQTTSRGFGKFSNEPQKKNEVDVKREESKEEDKKSSEEKKEGQGELAESPSKAAKKLAVGRRRSPEEGRGRKGRRSKSRERKGRSRSRERSRDESRRRKDDRKGRRSRSRSRGRRDERRRRCRSRERRRSRSRSGEKIDKKKLLEIALQNAKGLPGLAGDKNGVNLKILEKAGGRNIGDIVSYCQKLSEAEKDEKNREGGKESDEEGKGTTIRRTKEIRLNIPDAKQLATKTNQERLVNSAPLSTAFPVSSGAIHRDNSIHEWKKVDSSVPSVCLPEQKKHVAASSLTKVKAAVEGKPVPLNSLILLPPAPAPPSLTSTIIPPPPIPPSGSLLPPPKPPTILTPSMDRLIKLPPSLLDEVRK